LREMIDRVACGLKIGEEFSRGGVALVSR
jgi:hypothetical protein